MLYIESEKGIYGIMSLFDCLPKKIEDKTLNALWKRISQRRWVWQGLMVLDYILVIYHVYQIPEHGR